MIKSLITSLLVFALCGCNEKLVKESQILPMSYSVTYSSDTLLKESDLNFNLMNENKYEIHLKQYYKGAYRIADTNGKTITYYKPKFINISVNKGLPVTISSSLIASYSQLFRDSLNYSCFQPGETSVDKVDNLRKRVVFKTLFAPPGDSLGLHFYYAVGENGSFEFIELQKSNDL